MEIHGGPASHRRPSVIVADDQRLVLECLARLLSPEFHVLGMVSDGWSLVREVERKQPELVVTEVGMPQLNGIEAARTLRKLRRAPKIVFLTAHTEAAIAAAALEAGASAYVLKQAPAAELLHAMREALAGRSCVSGAIASELNGAGSCGASGVAGEDAAELTKRKREILQLLAEGHSLSYIARVLCLSRRTIQAYKSRIKQELNLGTGADLVRYAVERGIVYKRGGHPEGGERGGDDEEETRAPGRFLPCAPCGRDPRRSPPASFS